MKNDTKNGRKPGEDDVLVQEQPVPLLDAHGGQLVAQHHGPVDERRGAEAQLHLVRAAGFHLENGAEMGDLKNNFKKN